MCVWVENPLFTACSPTRARTHVHPHGAGRAAQHSLRLLHETSLGKTLADAGSTPAGLVSLRCLKPGAHGLAAGLTTCGPRPPGLPPGINITQNSENQIVTTTMVAHGPCKRMVCGSNPLVVRPRLLCGGVANTRTLAGARHLQF